MINRTPGRINRDVRGRLQVAGRLGPPPERQSLSRVRYDLIGHGLTRRPEAAGRCELATTREGASDNLAPSSADGSAGGNR